MGLITMGEWPEGEDIRIKGRQKMNISGVNGERIVRVKVSFRRVESEDRIVGLVIETDSGRSQTISRSEEKLIHLSAPNVKTLECGDDNEIVGFHGIVSVSLARLPQACLLAWVYSANAGSFLQPCSIHDIGLILRRKTQVTPNPIDN